MKITLYRPHSPYYHQRHFKIKINGQLRDYIADSEKKIIEVNPEDNLQVMIDTFTGGPKLIVSELKENTQITIYPKPFLAVFPIAGVFILAFIITISYIVSGIGIAGSVVIGILLLSYVPYLTIWRNQWLEIEFR